VCGVVAHLRHAPPVENRSDFVKKGAAMPLARLLGAGLPRLWLLIGYPLMI
jgi:hypothetical protein